VALHDVDLRVRAGEIVGVAGVAGNGQRELAEVVAGLSKPSAGRVAVAGRDVAGRGARAARSAGVSYVPEDRLGTGLSPSLSIADNLLLTRPRRFFLSRRSAEADAHRIIERYDVKATGPHAPTRSMSGGNIQKVLLGRELDATGGAPPKLVVVASPTRGLDVGATEMVRAVLDEHRRAGVAVLLISEDLDEVRSLSDRIVVLYEGRLVAEVDGDAADVEDLGLAMAGVRAP
jgi:simple sugar transport system ATP-binding protein